MGFGWIDVDRNRVVVHRTNTGVRHTHCVQHRGARDCLGIAAAIDRVGQRRCDLRDQQHRVGTQIKAHVVDMPEVPRRTGTAGLAKAQAEARVTSRGRQVVGAGKYLTRQAIAELTDSELVLHHIVEVLNDEVFTGIGIFRKRI